MPTDNGNGDKLRETLSSMSQGISSFFEEIDLFKMTSDKDHLVYVGVKNEEKHLPIN